MNIKVYVGDMRICIFRTMIALWGSTGLEPSILQPDTAREWSEAPCPLMMCCMTNVDVKILEIMVPTEYLYTNIFIVNPTTDLYSKKNCHLSTVCLIYSTI